VQPGRDAVCVENVPAWKTLGPQGALLAAGVACVTGANNINVADGALFCSMYLDELRIDGVRVSVVLQYVPR